MHVAKNKAWLAAPKAAKPRKGAAKLDATTAAAAPAAAAPAGVSRDLYQGYLASFGGDGTVSHFWAAQTWCLSTGGKKKETTSDPQADSNKPLRDTDNVEDIEKVCLPEGAGGPPSWTTSVDHAKWAITVESLNTNGGAAGSGSAGTPARKLVYIGDINRTQSQAKRGGGGVVIEDSGLWARMNGKEAEHSGISKGLCAVCGKLPTAAWKCGLLPGSACCRKLM